MHSHELENYFKAFEIKTKTKIDKLETTGDTICI